MSGDPYLFDGQRIDDADVTQANLYKLRQDGISAMSVLLNEARTENRILKETNSDLERALQQFTQSGAVPSEVVSNMAARVQGVSELYIPGISKPLMENLIRENGQLKRGWPISSQRLDELIKQVDSQQALIESLRADKHKLEQENADVKRVIQASGDELRLERMQLVERLQRAEDKYHAQASDCRVYCYRMEELKEQLADTARRCLEVRQQLHPNTSNPHTTTISPTVSTMTATRRPPTSNIQSVDQPDSHRPDKQTDFSEGRMVGHQHLLSEDDPHPPERKSHSRAANQQLQEEIRQLQELLKEKNEEIGKLREHQLSLQYQLEVYRDDYKKERTDRELTNQKYTDMQHQINQYKNMQAVRVPAASSLNAWDAKQPSKSANQISPNTKQYQADQSARRKEQPKKPQSVKLDSLSCSTCGKKYSLEKRDELKEHMDKCL